MARRMDTDTTTILSITNWTNSKAASNADGGTSSLETWLKNKAKRGILASQRVGDVLQIQVLEKDKRSFLHVDNWRWAGVDVKVTEGQLDTAPSQSSRSSSAPSAPRAQSGGFNSNQQRNGDLNSRITGGQSNSFNQNRNQPRELFNEPPSGPRGGGFQHNRQSNGNTSRNPFGQQSSNPFGSSQNSQSHSPPDALQETLILVVKNRYNAGEKFLDLSALALDPQIQAAGLTTATVEKVFSALFTVVEKHVFESREKRAEMIESVSFKNNSLTTVKEIIGASSTFYKIKNLDLSGNNFTKITDLTWWKNRFPELEQIILAGNPVDSEQTKSEVRKWFKNLKGYNLAPLDAAVINGLEVNPPAPVPSPIPGLNGGQIFTTAGHPEFQPGDMFGQPVPGKPDEQVVKEQLGLKFSFETGLKIKWVEECLVANNWDYTQAMSDLNTAMSNGNVPASAFVQAP